LQNKVRTILNQIKRQGDPAVARLLRRWDGVSLKPREWRVPLDRVRKALRDLPSARRSILLDAARQIERFHRAERKHLVSTWSRTKGGLTVGQLVRPVESAGLYVPGGRFAYPSTVLMTAIPAKVAGVERIVMATPPRHLTAEVLAAAALAGVHEIYQLGGVAAVGALAFGTRTVASVDLIVGPGGAWVTEAKRQVFGEVGIDLLAGPSEIVLLADDSAPPSFVAADMMAQAEHDPLARATLISPSKRTLQRVRESVEPRFRLQCRFLKARDWAEAAGQANRLAPEHLSLMVRHPRAILPMIRNAGAIFLGPWSPVAAGDYWAGPSHVLPTGRSARFSSGLSVQTFLKRSSLIGLSKALIQKKARAISALAEAEGLVYHAASLRARGEF
jgi:histidinol dehydrogenase